MGADFARADRSDDADEVTGMRIEHDISQGKGIRLKDGDSHLSAGRRQPVTSFHCAFSKRHDRYEAFSLVLSSSDTDNNRLSRWQSLSKRKSYEKIRWNRINVADRRQLTRMRRCEAR